MTSSGMMYIPSLMTIGSEIRVILRILPQQFERLYVVLVLLMGRICDVRRWDSLSGMIYTKQDYWYRRSSNIKVLSQKSERMQYWYYWHEGFIKYAAEMAPDDMICVPSSTRTGSGIQVILRLLPRQSERLQCWYYWWEELSMMCAVEMGSGGMICVPSSMTMQHWGCYRNNLRGYVYC
jgi:hypothetical protein